MNTAKEEVIALLGVNLGGGNLGEEITASALVKNIRKNKPKARIVEISSNPGDTKHRHGVECIPISLVAEARDQGLIESHFDQLDSAQGAVAQSNASNSSSVSFVVTLVKKIRPIFLLLKVAQACLLNFKALSRELFFLVRSYKRLRSIDKLIIAGSGPLADNFGGALAYPYLVFKWVLLSKLRGIPVIFFSVGAVPFEFRFSKLLVRLALNWAQYRSYRDETSLNIVSGIGVKPDGRVFPDIAFSYSIESSDLNNNAREKRVGIGLFPHFDPRYWPEKNQDTYDRYIKLIADFTGWLSAEGYHVVFLSTQVKADVAVTKDVISLLKSKGLSDSCYSTPRTETHEEFIKQASSVELMVLTRFHGLIMTLLSNTPIIALTNQQKMVDLMVEMKLDQFMKDIDCADLNWLQNKVSEAKAEEGLVSGIQESIKVNGLRLESGYEDILRI